MLKNYKPSMRNNELHSWASDAQKKINALTKICKENYHASEETFSMSPEGKDYLGKITKAIQL